MFPRMGRPQDHQGPPRRRGEISEVTVGLSSTGQGFLHPTHLHDVQPLSENLINHVSGACGLIIGLQTSYIIRTYILSDRLFQP